MTTIELKGLREAIAKLDRATSDAVVKRILTAGAIHLYGKAKEYPPSTEANQPRGFNSVYSIRSRRAMNTWYQRGYGSKWVRKDGSIGSRQSSEQLQQNWSMRVLSNSAVIGNNASYGIYVQDERKQASFHKGRGWRTIQDITEKERDTVLQFAKREVDRELAK